MHVKNRDSFAPTWGDLICSRVQGEVTGVEHVHFGMRHVAAVALRLSKIT